LGILGEIEGAVHVSIILFECSEQLHFVEVLRGSVLGGKLWRLQLLLKDLLLHDHLIELERFVDVAFGNLSELGVRNLAITVAV